MLMNIKELLGIEDSGLKDYEIVHKLQEARAKRLDEVSFTLPDGRIITIKLNQLNPESVMDESWWVRHR
jgi:hypothetical protein